MNLSKPLSESFFIDCPTRPVIMGTMAVRLIKVIIRYGKTSLSAMPIALRFPHTELR